MKRSKIVSVITCIASIQFFTFCSPSFSPDFTKIEKKPVEKSVKPHHEPSAEIAKWIIEETAVQPVAEKSEATASINKVIAIKPEIQERMDGVHDKLQQLSSNSEELDKVKMRALKKEIKDEFRGIKKELKTQKVNSDDDYVLMMILALIIPPLGVGLTYGLENEFWISLILTLLFWLPGAIYSLIMVHRHYN